MREACGQQAAKILNIPSLLFLLLRGTRLLHQGSTVALGDFYQFNALALNKLSSLLLLLLLLLALGVHLSVHCVSFEQTFLLLLLLLLLLLHFLLLLLLLLLLLGSSKEHVDNRTHV